VELGKMALAAAALERAMAADGDIDEYASLTPLSTAFAAEQEAAVRFVDKVKVAADKPYSSVGPALLRMASAVASGVGDRAKAAALLVQAARRAPEDDALVHEADVAVKQVGDESLLRSLDDALPVARRVEALLHLADKHEREGEDAQAIE